MSTQRDQSGELSGGVRVFCFLFGLYFLIGAAITVHDGKLFVGFPPQLDILSFIFGWTVLGIYIEALMAALLGLLCFVGALVGGKSRGA